MFPKGSHINTHNMTNIRQSYTDVRHINIHFWQTFFVLPTEIWKTTKTFQVLSRCLNHLNHYYVFCWIFDRKLLWTLQYNTIQTLDIKKNFKCWNTYMHFRTKSGHPDQLQKYNRIEMQCSDLQSKLGHSSACYACIQSQKPLPRALM